MLLGLEEHLQILPSTAPIWRKKALSRFQEIGFPSRHMESFQYIPLSQLYGESFTIPSPISLPQEEIRAYLLPECQGQSLVFVNGHFCPDLSQREALPPQIVILPLQNALGPYGQFLQSRLLRSLQEEQDPFALLNGALFDLGLFIYIPAKIRLERPIQCLHFFTGKEPSLITPRVQFFLGKEAEVDWISQTIGTGKHLILDVSDMAIEEGARIRHWQIPSPSKELWLFSNLRATLKRESRYQLFTYTRGAKTIRQEFQFSLLEEKASVEIKGLARLQEQNQAHASIFVQHAAPYTRSQQLYKQVLSDVSQGSFQGKILVQPSAQKTEAYQLNRNLILGARAQANSRPNLEIFADDVKASHGATISQVEEEHLLYLKTRGLSDNEARLLLVKSFIREILATIPFPSLQQLCT